MARTGVRTNGFVGDFTALSPRQRLTLVPYALVAGGGTDGSITAGKLAAAAVTAASLAHGSVGPGQLVPGAASANLASNGLSAVPAGGLILSATATNSGLDAAGYARLGAMQMGDSWRRLPDSAIGPTVNQAESSVWTGEELIVWTGVEGWRYDRGQNAWKPLNVAGAPVARTGHVTV